MQSTASTIYHTTQKEIEMAEDKTQAARIAARLNNNPSGRQPQTKVETHPTRTITHTYHSGFQAQRGDQVKTENDNG
jgi:hypothetical protein